MANVKKSDWLKKLTSKNEADVDEEYDGDDEEENGNGVQDVLSILNIDLQTQIPEDVKTSGQMSGVQFRVSKPKGYLFDDVDVALDAAITSLKTYERLIHKRDLDIHRLATEIDKKNTDYANLQFQAEAYRAKGKVVTGDDGKPVVVTGEVEIKDYNSLQEQHERLLLNQQELETWISSAQPYIEQLESKVTELEESANRTQAIPLPGATKTEDTDQTVSDLEQQVAELQAQLQQAQQVATSIQNEAASETTDQLAEQLSSDERQQFVVLREWAEDVQVKYSQMESYVAELEGLNGVAQQQVQELQANIESAQSELANVQSELNSAQSELANVRAELASAQSQVVDTSPYESQIREQQERISVLESEIEQRDDYIETLAAWAEQVEQQSQAGQQSAPEAAQEPVYQEESYNSEESPVGAYEEEEQFVPQTPVQRQPTPQAEPENDEDAFSRALREVNDPEVEGDVRRRPARSTGNYKSARPGSPLTSLPPGADINDYL